MRVPMAPRRWPISTTRSSCLPATPLKNNSSLRNSLPFADTRDFEEQTRGFVAAPASKQIMAEAWHVAWDMAKYEFCCGDRMLTVSTRRDSARPF